MSEPRFAKEFIQIGDEKLGFHDAAMMYYSMLKCGKPTCHICWHELVFQSADVYKDPYTEYVIAGCARCNIYSDACYFPKYNHSPIEYANGALTRAISEFERRVNKK